MKEHTKGKIANAWIGMLFLGTLMGVGKLLTILAEHPIFILYLIILIGFILMTRWSFKQFMK